MCRFAVVVIETWKQNGRIWWKGNRRIWWTRKAKRRSSIRWKRKRKSENDEKEEQKEEDDE